MALVHRRIRSGLIGDEGPDLTPMIDCVFLLLIFFMVTMRIVQEETELIIPLPSNVTPPEPPEHLPQNINIEIDPFGPSTT